MEEKNKRIAELAGQVADMELKMASIRSNKWTDSVATAAAPTKPGHRRRDSELDDAKYQIVQFESRIRFVQ